MVKNGSCPIFGIKILFSAILYFANATITSANTEGKNLMLRERGMEHTNAEGRSSSAPRMRLEEPANAEKAATSAVQKNDSKGCCNKNNSNKPII